MKRPDISHLSSKHKMLYKELILNGGNRLQAYISVYDCSQSTALKNASTCIKHNGIDKLYDQHCEFLIESAAKTKLVTLEEVLQNSRDVIESCKEDGKITDRTNMLKANEQLGRTIAAFADKHVVEDERTEEQKETLKKLQKKSKVINFNQASNNDN